MSELFQNKYRVKSTRLSGWDYSENSSYFVTICIRDRKMFFGNIKDSEMVLSELGKFAEKFWLEIPKHFPFISLDEHVVMPNHLHGVIDIDKADGRDVACYVSTGDNKEFYSKISPTEGSLGAIIRSFKSAVTREINKKSINTDFSWQSGFYEYIIRGEKDLNKIRDYIINNPANWAEDKNNPENFKQNKKLKWE